MTLQRILNLSGIQLIAKQVDKNPNMPTAAGLHFQCKLRRNSKQITVYFTVSTDWQGPPDLAVILDSMARDAMLIEDNSRYDDWCWAAKLPAGDKSTENAFMKMRTQTARFKELLGEELYHMLLWDIPRL